MGGSVENNILRWQSQFQIETPNPASPAATTPEPEVESFTVGNTNVTVVTLQGAYLKTGAAQPKRNHMLLGALIEHKDGLLVFKITGTTAAVTAARDDFSKSIRSLQWASDAKEN